MNDIIIFIVLGIGLIIGGCLLIVGVGVGRPRLRDASKIRLPRFSQLLLGLILLYFGLGAVLSRFDIYIMNGKVLASAIGVLLLISLVVEVKRIKDALTKEKNDK